MISPQNNDSQLSDEHVRRLLITGGVGFVGTNLVAQFSERGGYDLTVLDNETLGHRRHVEQFGV